jgi:uncharacterized protein (TIGR00255 family)
MPITSMTGYGKADAAFAGGQVSVEIKTVNNRYLEVSSRIPRELHAYELDFKELLGQKLRRGTVQLSINMHMEQQAEAIALNEGLTKQIMAIAQKVQSEYQIPGLTVAELLRIPDVLTAPQKGGLPEEILNLVRSTLANCIEQVVAFREAEGANLAEDLRQRVASIEKLLAQVEVMLPERIAEHQVRLETRLQNLLADQQLDPQRLAQEVAILVDKMDVSEEIVRFRSHNTLFLQTLETTGPHGKKLNFLLQEMGREANTLGTKSNFAEMQHLAIQLKEEIEIIREQVQNLE